MTEVFVTTKDSCEMAGEFSEHGLDFVAVSMDKAPSGKAVIRFSATSDDVDYEINYEFEAK